MDTGLLRELTQLLEQMTTENTVEKLPEEQAKALSLFFFVWAKLKRSRSQNPTTQEMAGELLAAFCLGHEWVGRHWLLWPLAATLESTTQPRTQPTTQSAKQSAAPPGKLTNINVDLGPWQIMDGFEVLGTIEGLTIEVASATTEELERLKAAPEIRLVRKR